MFIDWACVYDDGARPAASDVPAEQRRPLRIPIGEDVTIRIAVTNWAGAPVVLQSGDLLALTARSSKMGRTRLLAKNTTRIAPSKFQIAIAASDTRNLKAQGGTFDLVAVIASPAMRVTMIPVSEFALEQSEIAP